MHAHACALNSYWYPFNRVKLRLLDILKKIKLHFKLLIIFKILNFNSNLKAQKIKVLIYEAYMCNILDKFSLKILKFYFFPSKSPHFASFLSIPYFIKDGITPHPRSSSSPLIYSFHPCSQLLPLSMPSHLIRERNLGTIAIFLLLVSSPTPLKYH